MPLYEYECEACHHRFERIQKFSDPLVETCPTCGKGPVRKLISSPAIQFKGSGWYITDYAKKSSTDGGSAGTGGAADKKDNKAETSDKSDSTPKTDSSTSSSTSTTKNEK
jgi:putative FmdB family regulatory protein